MRQIWVVDDDRSIRWVLEKALTRAQMPFRLFESAADVVKAFEHDTPSVLLSDIRMHDMSGLDLLAFVKNKYPGLPVIIMTAFSDLDSAVSAFQGGAYEYLAKPFDINSAIDLLRRAREESTVAESTDASDLDDKGEERRTEIIGQSRAMQEVFRAIGRLSHSHVTVLLTGESGTGKEVVARALHQHSLRSRAPFVAINTAAIPRELLESELFGHERGAFTGANQLQYGRFEQAKGGTLFLDEIGDMPADLQTTCATGAFQRRPLPSLERDSPATAAVARTNRRYRSTGRSFSKYCGVQFEDGAQTPDAGSLAGDSPLPVSGQCPSIGKSLQLAHCDGSLAVDSSGRFAV